MGQNEVIINFTKYLLMIVISVIFVFIWKKRTDNSLKCIFIGGLAWVISVAVKSGIALLTNEHIFDILKSTLGDSLYIILGAIWLGFLTGITELPSGYLFAKKNKYRTIEQGIGFGLGFGVFEASIMALAYISIIIIHIFAPEALPSEIISGLGEVSINSLFVVNVERIIATIIHITTGLLIVYSIATKSLFAFLGAVLYKSLVDAVAGSFHLANIIDKWNPWILELILLPFAVLGIFIVKNIIDNWPTTLKNNKI